MALSNIFGNLCAGLFVAGVLIPVIDEVYGIISIAGDQTENGSTSLWAGVFLVFIISFFCGWLSVLNARAS